MFVHLDFYQCFVILLNTVVIGLAVWMIVLLARRSIKREKR